MACIPEKPRNLASVIFLIAFSSLFVCSAGHQSISYPTPISFDWACRIGRGRNCPGPCPTQLLRKDQSPTKATVTVQRGGILPVHILKNNHVGGFARWALVKISDMHSKKKHTESAFLFTCADVEVTKCTEQNRERDCKVDRLNEYYRYHLRIPRVYPDGDYVLGWLWYGGLVSTGNHGAFGEYWDCVYVRVKGGPIEAEHQPIFRPGNTMMGSNGFCKATTNRIGHCWREPCPFGSRPGVLMRPNEFEGNEPSRIMWKHFDSISSKRHRQSDVGYQTDPETRESHRTDEKAYDTKVPSTQVDKPTPQPSQLSDTQQEVFHSSEYGISPHTSEKGDKGMAKNLDGHTPNTEQRLGSKVELSTIKKKYRYTNQKGTMPLPTKKSGEMDMPETSEQRRLREKRIRKEMNRQKRREKQMRKAEARAQKLDSKRLFQKRIKHKRAAKRKAKRVRKQRMKRMRRMKRMKRMKRSSARN